jgi:hypothetical protein
MRALEIPRAVAAAMSTASALDLTVDDATVLHNSNKLALRLLPCGRPVGPPGPKWQGRNKPHRGDRRWVQAWSPEQIAKRLPVDFPDDGTMRISHEAIYQALYVQSRGGLQRELVACLRTGRALRVPRSRGAPEGLGARHARGDDQ